MAGELTNEGSALALDFLNGKTVATPSLTVHLMTEGGDEVSGGSYAPQAPAMSDATVADPAVATTTALMEFTGMPETTVAGYEVRSGATVLWAISRDGGTATVNAGDTFQIPAGGLDLSMT